MNTKSSIFSNNAKTEDSLDSLVEQYKLSEDLFSKVNKSIGFNHRTGMIFDGMRDGFVSCIATPLYYLTNDTPSYIVDIILATNGLAITGVTPEEHDGKEMLCYSDYRYGADLLVISVDDNYEVGKKYHKKCKKPEQVIKYGRHPKTIVGTLAPIEVVKSLEVTGNGGSQLYSASIKDELYHSYILKSSDSVYDRSTMFDTHEVLANAGFPNKYKATLIKGILLPTDANNKSLNVSVDGEDFGLDVNEALIFATKYNLETIEIKVGTVTLASLTFRNWKYIKSVIDTLQK